jgi:hypothetical protein
MGRRAIYTIGSLPENEEGSVARIASTDASLRFNCLNPVSDRTAETAVQRALIPYIGTFGVPEQ